MKNHKFVLNTLDAEKMWDFAIKHDVSIHFVRRERRPNEVENNLYTYEGYMSEETFLIFKLTVPTHAI